MERMPVGQSYIESAEFKNKFSLNYRIFPQPGKFSYKSVYQILERGALSNQRVIIMKCKVASNKFEYDIFKEEQTALNELESLRNPNILQMSSASMERKALEERTMRDMIEFVLFTQYFEDGNLHTKLQTRQNPALTKKEIFDLTFQIANGINSAHQINRVHLDLNINHIFCHMHEGNILYVIGNWENSIKVKNDYGVDVAMKGISSEIKYSSPEFHQFCEALPQNLLNQTRINYKKVDIYAIGVVLLMSAGITEEQIKQMQEIALNVKQTSYTSKAQSIFSGSVDCEDYDKFVGVILQKINDSYGSEFSQLVNQCIKFNPNERIAIQDLLKLSIKMMLKINPVFSPDYWQKIIYGQSEESKGSLHLALLFSNPLIEEIQCDKVLQKVPIDNPIAFGKEIVLMKQALQQTGLEIYHTECVATKKNLMQTLKFNPIVLHLFLLADYDEEQQKFYLKFENDQGIMEKVFEEDVRQMFGQSQRPPLVIYMPTSNKFKQKLI